MKATGNMSDCESENETIQAEYGDEILYAGWNPQIDLVCRQPQLAQAGGQPATPAALSAEVAELFLAKMYSCQR